MDLRDLAQAERWHRQGQELTDERDRLGRGRYLSQLGLTACERFLEAREARRSKEELIVHLNDALQFCEQALSVLPPDAAGEVADVYLAMGNVYGYAGDSERALAHHREAIGRFEAAGDIYFATKTRYNVALSLAKGGRFADAWEYARAAKRNFETLGAATVKEIQETDSLIAMIEQDIRSRGNKPL